MTIACRQCRREKDTSNFIRRGGGRNGWHTLCRECRSALCTSAAYLAKQRARYAASKESRRAVRLEYRERNRKRIAAQQMAWSRTEKGIAQARRRKESGKLAEAWRKYGAKPESKARAHQRFMKYKAERQWNQRLSENNRMKKYGLKRGQFAAMVAEREGKCDICRVVIASRHCLDHDHATGAVRGILCIRCNSMIGQAGDSVERLLEGVAYLRAHAAKVAAA